MLGPFNLIILILVPFLIIIGLIYVMILFNVSFNFFRDHRHLKFSDITYLFKTMRFLVKFVALTLGPKYEKKIITDDKAQYCGDVFDSTLCKCLYLNSYYEPSITNYLRDILQEGDVFVDVGANEGWFSILAGKLVGSSGKVYCIEPLPRNVSILEKNIQANDLDNIAIYDVAAGDEYKEVEFFDIKFNNMLGGARNPIVDLLSKIPGMVSLVKVDQKRIDELIDVPIEKIKAIKIDTEGYEELVIKGFDSWLNEESSMDFLIEMTPRQSKYVVDLLLNKYHYKGYMHWMDSVAFKNQVIWQKLDVNCNIQKNVLFTKNPVVKLRN